MNGIRTWSVALVAALIVAGCSAEDPEPAPESTQESTQESSLSPSASESSAASSSLEESPLEGSWQTATVSLADLEATIRANGLGQWVKDFRANAPFTDDLVLTLTIEDGAWDLYGQTQSGVGVPIDYDAEYEIDGDTVVIEHGNGATTQVWSVDGDTLRFEFVETTLPGYQGIPDEVYQRALYMTEAFTRQE